MKGDSVFHIGQTPGLSSNAKAADWKLQDLNTSVPTSESELIKSKLSRD